MEKLWKGVYEQEIFREVARFANRLVRVVCVCLLAILSWSSADWTKAANPGEEKNTTLLIRQAGEGKRVERDVSTHIERLQRLSWRE